MTKTNAHDIERHTVELHSGNVLHLFVNKTTGLVCLDLMGDQGGNEIFRKFLDERSLLKHLKGAENLPTRSPRDMVILTGTGTLEAYYLQNGLKWPHREQEEEAEEKPSYFLETIDSEILEDDYERGEGDYTGCGLPMTPIAKRFDSKEGMLQWIEDNYGYSSFEENETPGIMATSKTVADHSNAQNGGWFDPTEEELKLWKEGKMKLYTENVTIQYHRFNR